MYGLDPAMPGMKNAGTQLLRKIDQNHALDAFPDSRSQVLTSILLGHCRLPGPEKNNFYSCEA
jgi:hypothetical protein